MADQGTNTLLHQAGREKKRRQGEHSVLSFIKRRKLLCDPADQKSRKWITGEERSYESDSAISQKREDSY